MDECDVGVLVTAKLARTLSTACCGIDATVRSAWLLRARVVKQHVRANVACIQWRCSRLTKDNSNEWHSQWVDANDLVQATKPADANKVLRRGAHEQSFEAENSGRVELWTSPALGRFTVAAQRIEAGECALQATAFAVVVTQARARTHCHWCFAALVRKASQCAACQFARYCSRTCLDHDAPLHEHQCRALAALADPHKAADVRRNWRRCGIDDETIRLAVAVLSMERFVGSTAPLAGLVSNGSSRDARKNALQQCARFIVTMLHGVKDINSSMHVSDPFEHVCRTLERVVSNAHPVTADGAAPLAIGLFPDAAQALNHACLPNVVARLDRVTRTLAFHAIRSIAATETVACAYIDILQPTVERQRLLLDGFGFVCRCWRCVDDSDDSNNIHTLPVAAATSTRNDAYGQLTQRMLALHTATVQQDWPRVLALALALIECWRVARLPDTYPPVGVLWRHVQRAAERVGDTVLAKRARATADDVHRVCGFPMVS